MLSRHWLRHEHILGVPGWGGGGGWQRGNIGTTSGGGTYVLLTIHRLQIFTDIPHETDNKVKA